MLGTRDEHDLIEATSIVSAVPLLPHCIQWDGLVVFAERRDRPRVEADPTPSLSLGQRTPASRVGGPGGEAVNKVPLATALLSATTPSIHLPIDIHPPTSPHLAASSLFPFS